MPKFSAIFEANWLPAILVKETRQFVRSRLVVWVLILEMLGFAALSLIALFLPEWLQDNEIPFLSIPSSVGYRHHHYFSIYGSHISRPFYISSAPLSSDLTGQDQLCLVAFVLLFALALAAFDSLSRTSREHDGQQGEMLRVTGLTPWQVVKGKMLSGWILSLLLFSAGLPFLQLAYLMRGVSLVTLAAVSGIVALYAILSVAVSQVVGKLFLPGFVRRLGGLGLLLGLAFFFNELVALSFGCAPTWVDGVVYALLSSLSCATPGSSASSTSLWIFAAAVVVLAILLVVILFIMAMFFFSPPLSRRVFRSRLALTLLYGVGGMALVVFGMEGGLWILAILCALPMLVLALESSEFFPKEGRKFNPFLGGVAGGLFLAWAMFALAILAVHSSSVSASPTPYSYSYSYGSAWWERIDGRLLLSVFVPWLVSSFGLGWFLSRLVAVRFQRHPPPLIMALAAALGLVLVGVIFSGFCPLKLCWQFGVLAHLFGLGLLWVGNVGWRWLEARPPPVRSPSASDAVSGEETLKQRLFAEDWLLRPLSRLENINPIFLKEIRQLWRGRTATWLLWLFAGQILFSLVLMGSLFLESLQWLFWNAVSIPLAVVLVQFYRSIDELETQELLFVTRLTPAIIFRGKVLLTWLLGLGLSIPLLIVSFLACGFFNENFKSLVEDEQCLELLRSLLLLPLLCWSLAAVAVALAWAPLPAFHKRYLGPMALVPLALLPQLEEIPLVLWLFVLGITWLVAETCARYWIRRLAGRQFQS